MGFGEWAQAAAKAFASVERGTVDTGAPSRVMEQLGQWMGHLTRNATIHWGPNLLDPYLCVFCEEDAVTECLVCGDPVCLAHGLVNHRADAVCEECVAKMMENVKKRSNKRKRRDSPQAHSYQHQHQHQHQHHHHHHSQQQAHRASTVTDQQLQQALLLLGLQQGATWEQVQSAYKAAAVANHPDKYQGDQKTQAESRLKNINAAYNLLKERHRKAA